MKGREFNYPLIRSNPFYVHACRSVKNKVIGNKQQKIDLVNQGVVAKLLIILNDKSQPERVKIESVIVLGSLAKGDESNVAVILSSGALPTLLFGKLPILIIPRLSSL